MQQHINIASGEKWGVGLLT